MATSTFYTTTSDGYARKDHAVYATAHDSATAGNLYANASTILIGQWWYPTTSKYYVHRAFVYFDTSTIGAGATIISATLTLYTNTKAKVDTDFNIVIREGMPTYPHDPFVVGDYLHSQYSGNGGFINTANCSPTTNAANVITLNATGIGWINKAGTTKFALISSNDIDSLIPNGDEYIYFQARTIAGGTSVVPRLIVTFATEETPLVTTVAPTGIKATHCIGNGNVTAGGAILEKGFEYGLTEEADLAVKTSITSGEGTYSLVVSGLIPETKYYIRAWATNSYGTAYGEWMSFTTAASASYGLYEEDNTATICFYISEDDGKTWGQKHGPYTTDQADIEVTKLLVRGSGKKKIKFESDVLTGISASVMVKLDCKAR